MALGATIFRFQIELSDVGRAVYESLDLRVAQHPSETERHMVARVLAYLLEYEEGLQFGRGVSSDEPAVWTKDAHDQVRTWIEIGHPSAERLHKAQKRGARVAVYLHRDPQPLLRELARGTILRRQELAITPIRRRR